MAGERFSWQHCFHIPWEEQFRWRALAAIREYLVSAASSTMLNIEMEEDPETATRVWIGIRGPLPAMPINEFVIKIQKDISSILDNLIGPKPPPRSVWQWLRENPYK